MNIVPLTPSSVRCDDDKVKKKKRKKYRIWENYSIHLRNEIKKASKRSLIVDWTRRNNSNNISDWKKNFFLNFFPV